jgi:molecular chaperone GrpE
MMALPHRIDDEKVATEAVDVPTLMKENVSLRDRMMRALAEAENTRRQADRAIADARRFAVADFARELLIGIDNLERTVEAAKKKAKPEDSSLVEGVEATLRIFLQILERFGVNRIDAQGQRFDPNLHEAVMEEDDPSLPPNVVTRVLEPGYTLRDRLLRPARVVVTRKRTGEAFAGEDAGSDDNDLGSLWGRSLDQR